MNQRSLASLEQGVRRLHVRLRSGIRPDLCWDRFVAETGSELVDRSVSTFWDTIKLGGDPDQIGFLSSLFALKISLMRENRKLVSQTFMYLMVPLHAVLIGILLFVTEVMVVFAHAAQQHPDAGADRTPTPRRPAASTSRTCWRSHRRTSAFIRGFALVVTIVLTVVDTWSPHCDGRRTPPQGVAVRRRDAVDLGPGADGRAARWSAGCSSSVSGGPAGRRRRPHRRA